jgi:hypothetical protein
MGQGQEQSAEEGAWSGPAGDVDPAERGPGPASNLT